MEIAMCAPCSEGFRSFEPASPHFGQGEIQIAPCTDAKIGGILRPGVVGYGASEHLDRNTLITERPFKNVAWGRKWEA